MKLWNKIKKQFPEPKNLLVAFGGILVILFFSLIMFQNQDPELAPATPAAKSYGKPCHGTS